MKQFNRKDIKKIKRMDTDEALRILNQIVADTFMEGQAQAGNTAENVKQIAADAVVEEETKILSQGLSQGINMVIEVLQGPDFKFGATRIDRVHKALDALFEKQYGIKPAKPVGEGEATNE